MTELRKEPSHQDMNPAHGHEPGEKRNAVPGQEAEGFWIPKLQNDRGRDAEVLSKLSLVRAKMKEHGLAAVRLRGVDWFSWATAGGSSVVILTAEAGVAEVFIMPHAAVVLTNRIESLRLTEEEVPGALPVVEFPWEDALAPDRFVHEQVGAEAVASDRPVGGERSLPADFHVLRMSLLASEVERYRRLGEEAAQAMREALAQARPDWSEFRLAGAGAAALWSRGIHPTLTLVAGESRLERHRHPLPTREPLGGRAMMVFCGRRHGLYANLTRFVYFRTPSAREMKLHREVAEIEAAALRASRPGRSVGSVFDELAKAYARLGYADEIYNHHQGGPTGYLSREAVATASATAGGALVIQDKMALAWNPSLPGVKIEDTILVSASASAAAPSGPAQAEGGSAPALEILTGDPLWPSIEINGLSRPDVWVRT